MTNSGILRKTLLMATACLAMGVAGCVKIDETVTKLDSETNKEVRQATGDFDTQLNAFRAQNGRQPMTRNARLQRAADKHAADMVARGYFSHRSPEGKIMNDRIRATGYKSCTTGENIAEGWPTEAVVFKAWTKSAAHRKILLNPKTTEYGLGQAGDHWVYLSARPC